MAGGNGKQRGRMAQKPAKEEKKPAPEGGADQHKHIDDNKGRAKEN